MSKIIQVINTMITNEDKIGQVIKSGIEYFFTYQNKYKWSITNDEQNNDYLLHLYPDEVHTIKELADSPLDYWEHYTNYVTYRSSEHKGNEAIETFRDLFNLVKSKTFGVDKILNDILADRK